MFPYSNCRSISDGFFNRPFVESFHGRFRDECLNRELLWTLSEAPCRRGRLTGSTTTTLVRTASLATKARLASRQQPLHRRLRSGSARPAPTMDKPTTKT